MTVTMTMEEYEAMTANLMRAIESRNQLRKAVARIEDAMLGEPGAAVLRVREIVSELKVPR